MRTVSLLILSLVSAGNLVSQTRGVLPQDYYRTAFLSDVQVSPTGEYVAFTLTTVVEAKNTRHREVWLQHLVNGRPVDAAFRFTGPTEESSGPRWSPDGSVLAFSSRRGDDRNSVWFARVTGPGGEAFHVAGVDAMPTWSPDGKWIAFTRAPEAEEAGSGAAAPRGGGAREGWISPNAITHTLDAKRFDGRVITSMRYKRDGVLTLLPDPSIRQKSQLFVVPATGGEPTQLTDFAFDVGGGGFGGGGIAWSPDGSTIYVTGNPEQDNEYNEESTLEIYAVPRAGGEARLLTSNPGSESNPAVSPDGKWMAYTYTASRGSQPEIMVVALGADGAFAGQPRNLTADWDLIPGSPEWTPDGRSLRWEAGIGGNDHLFEVATRGGPVRQVTTGDRQVRSVSWSGDGKVIAYTSTDAVTPAEVFVAGWDGKNETRVTSFNDSWLAETVRMPAERLTWKVGDGTEIEGWVIKPVGYDPSRKYPMALEIHGGPYGAFGNTFYQEFHVLSAAGMFVLYTNPRGSTGYGQKYEWATQGAWGIVDSADYLRGVDAALAKYPSIDGARLGVTGGSYGGYMTNWLSATRSITSWESWYYDSDAQGLTEYAFGGTPYEQPDVYRRLSPINYVKNVKAATLIIHSENDFRVPISDGEQWFMALKKMKVPVEFVRYPRSSHGLSRTGEPWLLVDRLERIRSWMVYWLEEHPERAAKAGSR
jgi:dipeptidyl aminopeptidase/acylaminoacyl peptidase